MPRPPNRNYAYAQAFVEELVRSGLHHACICPGSRSTPLVMSLAKQEGIRTWVHLDERSAAYFALGVSRALNEPAAVVSTSGTAAANFYPAVIEAHYSQAPILIITADRPPEVLDWGANQTIDQTRLYGRYSKWFVNMVTPQPTPDLLRYAREVACRAVSTAALSPSGPVHINFPFGEPLVPKQAPTDIPEDSSGREHGKPFTRVRDSQRSATASTIKQLAGELHAAKNGVIVCGPQHDLAFPTAISKLAELLQFPVLADPLSQVRSGNHDRALVVDAYDAFLRSEKCARELNPELFLQFGATPTSKVLQNYIAEHHRARHILVNEGDWQDQYHVATDIFQANPNRFVTDLVAVATTNPDREWCDRFLRVNRLTGEAIRKRLNSIEEIFEGKVFAELARLLPPDIILFAGNSMPVRDLDAFYPSSPQQIRFMANRGASGIDGVMSTALGTSAVAQNRTVLVVGDLSFYHDMNGLFAAKQYKPNMTIILVNNNGGGIFSFLPQREYKETFEEYFVVPHSLTFQPAATLYELPYLQAASWPEFEGSVSKTFKLPGTSIVEIQTNRDRNVELHKEVVTAATTAAENALSEWT